MTTQRKTIEVMCGTVQIRDYDTLISVRDRINIMLNTYGDSATVRQEYDQCTEADEWVVYQTRDETDNEMECRLTSEKKALARLETAEYVNFLRLTAKFGPTQ